LSALSYRAVTESGRSRPMLACDASAALAGPPVSAALEHPARVAAVSRSAAEVATALMVAIFIEKPPIDSVFDGG
jgi:hypothetical protein